MKYPKLITGILSLSILMGTAVPAFAEEGGEPSSGRDFPGSQYLHDMRERMEERKQEMEDRHASSSITREERKAEREEHRAELSSKRAEGIDKSIEKLTELKERLSNSQVIPAEVLASILERIDAQIAKLTDLKARIAAGTAPSSTDEDKDLKGDLHDARLVSPQAHIAASAARIGAVISQMNELIVKLEARVAEAKDAGSDMTDADAAIADMKAALADAKTQADAAVDLTKDLTFDGGDATVRASNLAALKEARAKLVAAAKDLADARHSAAEVRAALAQ